MAQLKITDWNGRQIVFVGGVPMPDGAKRDYVDFGREGFKRILDHVRLDIEFIRQKMLARDNA